MWDLETVCYLLHKVTEWALREDAVDLDWSDPGWWIWFLVEDRAERIHFPSHAYIARDPCNILRLWLWVRTLERQEPHLVCQADLKNFCLPVEPVSPLTVLHPGRCLLHWCSWYAMWPILKQLHSQPTEANRWGNRYVGLVTTYLQFPLHRHSCGWAGGTNLLIPSLVFCHSCFSYEPSFTKLPKQKLKGAFCWCTKESSFLRENLARKKD